MWQGKYEKKALIAAEGGIKAQTKRGEFAQKWWAQKWIQALESFHDQNRLSRGRSYARKGQVLTIDIGKGRVTATVQGTRKKPYDVEIMVDTIPLASWRAITERLSLQAFYVAKLLSGEIPHEIEALFDEAAVPLFPTAHQQVQTDCSCPDWSNPCKHVAAVFYLIGEAFDRDPFLIFKLRGIEKELFIDLLENEVDTTPPSPQQHCTPLPDNPAAFWDSAPLADTFSIGESAMPQSHAALIHTLGKFPFWRGNDDLHSALKTLYAGASQRAHVLMQRRAAPLFRAEQDGGREPNLGDDISQ